MSYLLIIKNLWNRNMKNREIYIIYCISLAKELIEISKYTNEYNIQKVVLSLSS